MSFFEYIFGGNKEEKKPEDAVDDIIDDLEKLNIAEESSVDADGASIVIQLPENDCFILKDEPSSNDDDIESLFGLDPVDNSGKGSTGNSDPINQLIENEHSSGDYSVDDLLSEVENDGASDLLAELGIDECGADNPSGDDLLDSLLDLGLSDDYQETSDDLSGLFEEPKREQNLSIDKIVKTSDKIKELAQNGNFTTALSVIDQLPANYKKDALYTTVALAITQELGKESYTLQSKELLNEMLTKVKKLSTYLERIESEDE